MKSLDNQMQEIDDQIGSLFGDCKDHPYRLHAVFMHRGTAKAGHYWIYIYDSQNRLWRNYNDEYVDEVEVKNVLEQEGTATSTGVVYVQEDLIGVLTEAVNRRLAPENVDDAVEMKEASAIPASNLEVIEGIELE